MKSTVRGPLADGIDLYLAADRCEHVGRGASRGSSENPRVVPVSK